MNHWRTNVYKSKNSFSTSLMVEALLLLLEKKDYEFITVTEICQKAGVNRSTFYLHYEQMDDLLIETLDLINKKFHEAFDNKTLDVRTSTKEDLLFSFFLLDNSNFSLYT